MKEDNEKDWIEVDEEWEEEADRLMEEREMKELDIERDIIERLAELEHEQWIKWSKSIVENENISLDRLERWKKLWIPYKELSEEMKEHDRVWARKVLNIIEKDNKIVRKEPTYGDMDWRDTFG